jgi:hypothetical protein
MENQEKAVMKTGQGLSTVNKEKSLSTWIVSASKMLKVSDCEEAEIRKMIAYLMILVGFKESPSNAETMVLVDFINARLSKFTIEEFKVAFTLFIEGRLDIDREHYNSFSSIYLGRVMESYGRYRFNYLKTHQNEVESIEETTSYGPADIEKLIVEQFNRFIEKKTVFDFGSVQYRYLDGLGLIPFTKEQKKEFMRQAEKIYISQNTSLAGRVLSNDNKESAVIDIARLIALREYYGTLRQQNIHISTILPSKA